MEVSMLKLTKALFAVMVTSMLSLVAAHDKVSVQGGGTMQDNNPFSGGYNVAVNKFNICAEGDTIKKGKIRVSSFEAASIDPITGIDFEAIASVDGIRVFADHPDCVWVHGFAVGSITFGTAFPPPLGGTTHIFTPTDGEYIGVICTFGRSNFLSVFENGGPFPINFFTATESQLTSLVGGFSRTLLTTGAEPGKICIETHGGNITIP